MGRSSISDPASEVQGGGLNLGEEDDRVQNTNNTVNTVPPSIVSN